jgi:hypothetical protein
MAPSRRWFVLLYASSLPLVFASVASADQQRIFAVVRVMQNGEWAGQLIEAVAENGRVVSVADRGTTRGYLVTGPGTEHYGPTVVGGRFVVWVQHGPDFPLSPSLKVFDRQTGSFLVESFQGSLPLADPTRTRLFYLNENGIATLSDRGVSIIPNTDDLSQLALSADASRLFAVAFTNRVVALDVATGHRLQTIPLPTGDVVSGPLTLSEDETRIWVATATPGPVLVHTLRRFNLATGREELAIPLRDGISVDGVVIDSVSHRAAIAVSILSAPNEPISGELRFVNTDTGTTIETFPLEGFSDVHFDRPNRRLVVLSRSQVYVESAPIGTGCGPVAVRTFDGLSGPPIVSTSDSEICMLATIVSPPAPPVFQPATVASDRTVTLSWAPPTEMTTGFVVEAGSAPGLADLASMEVSGSTIAVPNVPPGSYYVRVRSRNDLGVGAASNEHRVDVP